MCKVKSENSTNHILEQLVKSKYNKSTKKYHKLIDIILNKDFLEKCYFRIKSNPGNSTPLVMVNILDGII
jgi:hypothetical protein